ncbi:hypothetical protein PRNP1_012939 [Phytophthora ramorum]
MASLVKGLAGDLTGTADVCKIIADFSKCLASEYLLPNETIAFSMISTKEEFTFANMALIKLEGESATTTRKLVERYKCKSIALSHVKFESHEQGRKAELPPALSSESLNDQTSGGESSLRRG